MGNYVDPEAVRPPIPVPCSCPRAEGAEAPHDQDYVTVVRQFGYGAKGVMRETARRHGAEAYNQKVLELGIRAWTFILPDGKPRPVDAEQIARLDEPTVEVLLGDGVVGLAFLADDDPLPNGSSAPSDSGSRGSATTTLTSPAPEASTTS